MGENLEIESFFQAPQRSKFADRFLAATGPEVPQMAPPMEAQPRPDDEISDVERIRRTLFIGNLPASCTTREIKKLLPSKDSVINVRLRNISLATSDLSRKVAVRRGKIDKTGTCSAYVFMKAPSDVTEAVDKLNGTRYMDHILRVDQATEPGKRNRLDKETNRRSIFVGSVPFEAKEEELAEVFQPCGKIHHVRIPRDAEGKGRGIAYVTFVDEESVELALRFNKAKFKKQVLKVERSNPAKGEKTKKKHEMERLENKFKGKKPEKMKPETKGIKFGQRSPGFEGKRAKSHDDDKNQSIKTYLKMKAHIRKKRAHSVGK
jgi:nucleolar protein 12